MYHARWIKKITQIKLEQNQLVCGLKTLDAVAGNSEHLTTLFQKMLSFH